MDTGYAYVGILPCGCCVAIASDKPECKDVLAEELGKWVLAGLTVERKPVEWARANFRECTHKAAPKPDRPQLFPAPAEGA